MSAAGYLERLSDEARLTRPFSLLWRLALDERAARARRTLLGRSWALFMPLLESGALALVFGALLKVRGSSESYLAFAYVGVFAWRIFSRSLTVAANALNRHALLLLSTPVSAGLVVGAAVAAVAIDGLLALPLVIAVVSLLEGLPDLAALALWLPVGVLLHLAFTLGLGLMLGITNAFYRDVGIVLPPALAVLMFAAPVVYPATLVPEPLRSAFLANPISSAIDSFRAALMGTAPVSPEPLLAAALIAFMLLVVGLVVAKRFDHRAREVL